MDTSPSTQTNTRLRQARIARNWRQADLAEQLGTTVASVKRWERGSHQPSAYYRIKLCTLFGMSSQELGLIPEMPNEEHTSLLPATPSLPGRSSVRIFVSYLQTGNQEETLNVQRLIADMQAAGADIVIDNEPDSDAQTGKYLHREMGRCDYLILVQTPQSLQSPRVQRTANLAAQMVAEQHLKGVLRFIATPSENESEPFPWNMFPAMAAHQGYPNVRDRLLQAVGLLQGEAEKGDAASTTHISGTWPVKTPDGLDKPLTRTEKGSDEPPPTKTFRRTNQRRRTSILIGVILSTLILGGVLVAIEAWHKAGIGGSASAHLHSSVTPGANRSQATSSASGNALSTVDPYSTDSTLVLNDNLTSATPNLSQWDVTPAGNTYGCFFREQTYDLILKGLNYCVAGNTDVGNFVYQIQCTILQGKAAGIIFRTDDGSAQTYYIFEITTDGGYFIQRNDSSEDDVQLSRGNSPSIHTGFKQPNLLAVDANGGMLTFYINGINITGSRPLTDNTYMSGKIGVIVGEQQIEADSQAITEATYNDARVWI